MRIVVSRIANKPRRGERNSKSAQNGCVCGGTQIVDDVGIDIGMGKPLLPPSVQANLYLSNDPAT
jgi:hypothetical protein